MPGSAGSKVSSMSRAAASRATGSGWAWAITARATAAENSPDRVPTRGAHCAAAAACAWACVQSPRAARVWQASPCSSA